MARAKKPAPQITKRKVTMRSISLGPAGETVESVAVDYVRPDFLDTYVHVARQRWQSVEVSEEPDAGPAGYDGPTYVPLEYTVRAEDGTRQRKPFPHPLAGSYFPATDCGPDCKHAPEGAHVVYVPAEG